jgi:hypothetical protein
VFKKTAVLEYEKIPSKIDEVHDITHTSLPSKALVMCDVKGWLYLYTLDTSHINLVKIIVKKL